MRQHCVSIYRRGLATTVWSLLLLCSPLLQAQEPHSANQGSAAAEAQLANHEDWNSLSLVGSHLIVQPPVAGEKADFETFTRELIQVQWRLGDTIDLYIIRPKGVAKPPVVLYLYSYPSETARFRDQDYCAQLTRDGFAAVGFVSALTGQRYSMRPMKEWFVSELQESLATSVHDVQMILNFLSQRENLNMSRVGIFGTGSGATIAILSAAVDPRIKALDLLTPWGDWPDWVAKSSLIPENERANYLKPEFLKKVEPLDPLRWLPELKSQQVRVQNIADDSITPKVSQEKVAAVASPNVKVQTFENARQFYATASSGRIFEWMKSQLRSRPGSQPSAQATDAAPKDHANQGPFHND